MEVMQSFSDKPLQTCPVCMGPLQKQLYPVGVIYKGSGYYSTDYRSPASRESGESGKEGKEGKAAADGKAAAEGGGAAKESGSKEKSGSSE
jgi:putative FmdB family regulatory protein